MKWENATLSNDAFFGHYAGTSTYKIESRWTDDALYLSCASKVESGNKWWYRFIPKEKCEACGYLLKQLF